MAGPSASTTIDRTEGPSSGAAAGTEGIRPFSYTATDAELSNLRERISATRWPDRETVSDTSQGVQLATMQALASHWAKEYDWRNMEARLAALPQFVTEIDGLDIHFVHVRSQHENALPMIVTHGWPGSIIEQLKIIEPLTNPTAHGGTAAEAFHLVIPSLPGHGFSEKPTKPGWTPVTIAAAWATLMRRLGYERYVAQGGDWGNAVSEIMALQQPPGLLGIHTNMPAAVPPKIAKALAVGEAPPADLAPEERNAWNQLDFFYKKGLGYALEMNTRPQTLLRAGRLTDRARGLDARPRCPQPGDDRPGLCGDAGGADPGRRPRQHHALLADKHRDLLGAPLLGHRANLDGGLLRRSGRTAFRWRSVPFRTRSTRPQRLGQNGLTPN